MFPKFYFSPDESSGGGSGVTPATVPATPVVPGATPNGQQAAAIDWSTVSAADVPTTVLESHPLVVALHKRVGERDAKILKMRDAVSDEPAKPATPATPATDEVPAWAKSLIEKVDTITSSGLENTLKIAREAAIAQYHLDAGYAEFLKGSTPSEINAAASKLAALRPGTTSPGNAGGGGTTESKAAMLIAKMQGETDILKAPSIFDLKR